MTSEKSAPMAFSSGERKTTAERVATTCPEHKQDSLIKYEVYSNLANSGFEDMNVNMSSKVGLICKSSKYTTRKSLFAALIALIRTSVFSRFCATDNNCTSAKSKPNNTSQSFSSGNFSL